MKKNGGRKSRETVSLKERGNQVRNSRKKEIVSRRQKKTCYISIVPVLDE
jgi:hypothetical protein